ncbi:serine/threonine-protein kinase polo-like [Convolutriloba macropyga]|uniref:serine/threonine-protein kinase polo-like n=1 Tax=Convolutriloba macropyga TaxID=536237 RepID=UPI003F523C90
MATVEKGGGEKGEKGASGATEDPPVLTRQTISAGGENNNESYTFLNAIGKGGYADVYKVQNKEGSSYACKAIPKSRLTSTSKLQKVRMEIAIHKSLEHENIVKFVSTFDDETFIFIVLEYCQHRSMNILIKQRTTLTDPEVRYFLVQVMDALGYLHNRRIIHRDLKAGNILLKGASHLTVKLCDFGLSALLTHDSERRKTMCGTPNYIAPEILQNTGHSYEADIWSLACLMFALITGKPPFQTRPIREIYAREPSNRPKLADFKGHDYFNEWTPPAIGLDVYDDCPSEIKEHIRNQRNSTNTGKEGSGRSGTTESSAATGHLRNYVFSNNQIGSKVTHGARSLLERQPSMEYVTVVTNMQDSPRSPSKENVILNYESLNDDGRKLVEKIEQCVRNFKPTSSLRHIAKANVALIWAIKWVDYSDTNQGFGYQLSDGSYGVLFKNETKMMLLPDGETIFFLTKRDDSKATDRFNMELKKARGRLEVFVQYMTSNLIGFNIDNIRDQFPTRTIKDQPFPITWTRGWDEFQEQDRDYLIIIVIRPAIYQINFEDHSKVIIDYNDGKPMIMYQKDGSIALLTELETLGQMGYTEDLHNKLKIAVNNFKKITTPPPI